MDTLKMLVKALIIEKNVINNFNVILVQNYIKAKGVTSSCIVKC